MAKKAQVLKNFSDLQPVERQRIELVASGILQLAFKGVANRDFEPKVNTQVHRTWKMAKLDERQQIAWQSFCDDVRLAYGKSGSVCGSYGDQIDNGSGDGMKIPKAFTNTYYRRIEKLLTEFLDRHERALLYALLQDDLRGDASFDLETIGIVRSGYSKDKVSARAAGVVHVQTLLSRLARYYGV